MAKHTFFCVLKTGQWKNKSLTVEYRPQQVTWLEQQIEKHYPHSHEFICLTDVPGIEGVKTIPLKHNWPGWWSKMELFRPDLDYVQAFYLDLDTVITGDLTPLVEHDHQFTILKNLSRQANIRFKNNTGLGSAVMAWRKGYTDNLYTQFLEDPQQDMATYTTNRKWGDQGFIEDHQPHYDYFQELWPGSVVSYKFGLRGQDPGPEAKIVCFHGAPKPWETRHPWVPPMG